MRARYSFPTPGSDFSNVFMHYRKARPRRLYYDYSLNATHEYDAYLQAYQEWPDGDILTVQGVEMKLDIPGIVSVHGKRVVCQACQEEIINEREVVQDGRVLCAACAGNSYFRPA